MAAKRTSRRSMFGRRGLLALRTVIAVSASASVVAVGAGPAWAATATDPYSATPYGYDVSYPQCPGSSVPTAPAGDTYTFAIVGVGGGRPFTSNSCASTEVAAATYNGISNIALYFNTGYSGAYGRNIDSACTTDVSTGADDGVFLHLKGHALSADQHAWEIGCSEALYAQLNAPTSVTPTMWWADVETGNSWSTNTSLNDFAIDGLSYQMQTTQTSGGGGFYSYTSAWAKIAGKKFTPTPPENGNWVAFAGNKFNGVKNFVTQNGTSGGADTDLGS